MIECRGRNGWFKLYDASAYVCRDGTASVSLVSKQPYRDMPPIYFSGPKEEILALLDQLRKELA